MTSARIVAAVTAAGPDDPIAAMRLGTAAFLDIYTEPEAARIMLIDAPAVLGEQAGETSAANTTWASSCSSSPAALSWTASARSQLTHWRASCSARSGRRRCTSPARPTPPPHASRWAPS